MPPRGKTDSVFGLQKAAILVTDVGRALAD
jgi:hypothetical protein